MFVMDVLILSHLCMDSLAILVSSPGWNFDHQQNGGLFFGLI